MDGFPSSRRHPRTLFGANGAFPLTAEYAAAIHRNPRPSLLLRALVAVALVGLCALLAAAGAGGAQ